MRLLLLLACAAMPAQAADRPLSPEEFEAYTTGKTLFYGIPGEPYGAEQYFRGRRVTWSFLDGECHEGRWYAADELICFVYDDLPGDPQCWSFFLNEDGLSALFANTPGTTELIETENGQDPLICPGPEVGV